MKPNTTVLIFALLCLLALPIKARVKPQTVEQMIINSDIIVIGSSNVESRTNATITITEVLKGSPRHEIDLCIDKRIACEISLYESSNTSLYFLCINAETGRARMYALGRGQMPIVEINNISYAAFYTQVIPPHELEATAPPELGKSFERCAQLDNLKEYIKQVIAEEKVREQERRRERIPAHVRDSISEFKYVSDKLTPQSQPAH